MKGRFKFKNAASKFVFRYPLSMIILKKSILDYSYTTSDYGRFYITDTKTREIRTPSFRDKLVQYAINNICSKTIEKMYIKDSYACIKGRGPQAAVLKLKKYQCLAYKYYKEPILVKLDISKFFYSINRYKVFDLLCKIIKCEDTRILLAEKLKFLYSRKGLPLGNLTSQQFANLLLNSYDQYAKRTLKIKYYIRYADDIFIIADGKEKAKEIIELSKHYLEYNLDLKCNPKKCYYGPANTIVGLGYKIIYDMKRNKNYILLLSRNKRKLYKIFRIKYVMDKTLTGILKKDGCKYKNKSLFREANVDDILIRLNSWLGHAKLANLNKYIIRTLKRNKIDYIKYENNKFSKV